MAWGDALDHGLAWRFPRQLLLIETVCGAAGFIRGLTGFGLAIVLVPLISVSVVGSVVHLFM